MTDVETIGAAPAHTVPSCLRERREKVIYALCDPNGEPRYVGHTYWPEQRLKQHLDAAKKQMREALRPAERDRWIMSLLDAGQVPLFQIIEVVPAEEAFPAELRWVLRYSREGCRLTNCIAQPTGRKLFSHARHTVERQFGPIREGLVSRIRDGRSYDQIAREWGVHVNTVQKWIKEEQLTRRRVFPK